MPTKHNPDNDDDKNPPMLSTFSSLIKYAIIVNDKKITKVLDNAIGIIIGSILFATNNNGPQQTPNEPAHNAVKNCFMPSVDDMNRPIVDPNDSAMDMPKNMLKYCPNKKLTDIPIPIK